MNGAGLMDHFRAYSLSIATHALDDLAEFPDSRAFYAGAADFAEIKPEIRSLLYMATCNRIELYAEFAPETTTAEAEQKLSRISPVFARMLEKKPQVHCGGGVLDHMISVASGLKSLALGETQIAGQLKRDMGYATQTGWLSAGMLTLIKKALETQKKIRTSTGISENSYSLMSLVDDAITERRLRPLQGGVILVGASEMSAKVARFALRRNVEKFLLVRKDLSRPMNAEIGSLIDANPEKFRQVTLGEMHHAAADFAADAIILASSAPQPLFSAADFKNLIGNRVLMADAPIVDLSLPANVHADVTSEFGERVISLNSLQAVSEAARADRLSSAAQAEPIIRRAVYQFWLDMLYRENPDLVQMYLETKTQQTETEWQRLAEEASLSEKQKRIMYDFLKKEQRRALSSHREMILDLMAGSRQRQTN